MATKPHAGAFRDEYKLKISKIEGITTEPPYHAKVLLCVARKTAVYLFPN